MIPAGHGNGCYGGACDPDAVAAAPATADDTPGYPPIAHEDFVYALSQIDTFIDVSEEDLLRIYELATHRVA